MKTKSYTLIISAIALLFSFGFLNAQTPETTKSDETVNAQAQQPNSMRDYVMSEENLRLLSDKAYRDSIYPKNYTFEAVPELLSAGQLRLSIWYLVNLFESNPDLTIQIAQEMRKRKIGTNEFITAFYTYALTDPEMISMDGPEGWTLDDPQKLERKLTICHLLATYE